MRSFRLRIADCGFLAVAALTASAAGHRNQSAIRNRRDRNATIVPVTGPAFRTGAW